MKLKEFAALVSGKIHGDAEIEITGISGIQDAQKGDITLLSSPKYKKDLTGTQASCVIVKTPLEGMQITQLAVSNPYYAFARGIEHFYPKPAFKPGISSQAKVSDNVHIGRNVSIYPFSFISDGVAIGDDTVILPGVFIGENTRIGSQCLIYPHVVLREDVLIGDRVIIHAGTVVGSDGYGYVFENREHYKIPQRGGVIIEDDVEIGSNVSIDRATLGHTIIGSGSKIDNLVQVAHNVKIGNKSLLVAQVGIGGSSTLGNFVTVAGQVGIADHTTIESGTLIGAQSGLSGDIPKGAYSGSPAIPHKTWLRAQALFGRLPEMNRKLRELEERLQNIEKGDSQ